MIFLIALGGINLTTMPHLPKGFQGIAGISIFNHSIKQYKRYTEHGYIMKQHKINDLLINKRERNES